MACSDEVCQLRVILGDFEEPYKLPDEVLQYHIDSHSDAPSEEIQLWLAALDSLQTLMRKYAAEGSRRREREGSVEVEDYRNELYQAVKDIYDDLVLRPPRGVPRAGITIGGTSVQEVNRVNCDPDSVTYGIEVGWFEAQNTYQSPPTD